MKIIYSADGHSMRDATPVRIDKRDLDPNGRPKPGLLPVGDEIARSAEDEEPGWVEFDHVSSVPAGKDDKIFDRVLTEKEREKEFPGYADRVKQMAHVESIKQAAAMAACDDEIATLISAGTLKVSDFADEIAALNARLELRKKKAIA